MADSNQTKKPLRSQAWFGLKDRDGKQIVPGIFAAVPYCIDLIGGPYIETNEDVIKAFRPKSAIRPKKG